MNALNPSGWRPGMGDGGGGQPSPTASGDRGLALEEPLIFELGQPGTCGVDFDGEDAAPGPALARFLRAAPPALPGLSEPETVRHYTRLSRQNYGIDLGPFPLGSCTMKHNPRLNEKVARLPGFADLHPLQPTETVQGALGVIAQLAHWLVTLTGMQAVAMTPKAGAHGELCGVLCIKAALAARGDPRSVLLVPESAHGTNPATAAFAGFSVESIPADSGKVRPGDLGIDAMHINLHKTFSTPHGGGGPGSGPVVLSEALAPFAPLPYVAKAEDGTLRLVEQGEDGGQHFGRMAAFHGQMGMFTRALAYILSHGADGLARVAEDAVLGANYVLRSLEDVLDAPFAASGPCMHEALFSDMGLAEGFSTIDVAKGLIDEGFHPMTVYFPLVVHGAMLVEPTETESKAGLDRFISSLRSLATRARAGDELLKSAPHLAPRRRLDETQAARKPVLVWRGDAATC